VGSLVSGRQCTYERRQPVCAPFSLPLRHTSLTSNYPVARASCQPPARSRLVRVLGNRSGSAKPPGPRVLPGIRANGKATLIHQAWVVVSRMLFSSTVLVPCQLNNMRCKLTSSTPKWTRSVLDTPDARVAPNFRQTANTDCSVVVVVATLLATLSLNRRTLQLGCFR
jgi:hypothetical protein